MDSAGFEVCLSTPKCPYYASASFSELRAALGENVGFRSVGDIESKLHAREIQETLIRKVEGACKMSWSQSDVGSCLQAYPQEALTHED